MPARPEFPSSAPMPPGTSSGKRIVWLLGLLLAGFALIFGLQTWYSGRIDELDARSANERTRLFIGEEILRGISDVERDVYRLATTTGAKGQQLVEKRILDNLEKLRHDMVVLQKGGTVRQTVDLNLPGRDQMTREVDYQPPAKASAYVLELIELEPWLDEIRGKVGQLRAQIAKRDLHRAGGDATKRFAGDGEIDLFLKQIPPLFIRLTENANRLLYENQSRQADLDAQLAMQKSHLERTKQVLILLVVVGILLPGAYVVQQINAANLKLRLAWEDMRLARDEAERANLAKSEFLSRMSHELRTPLNAILGFGQLLESDAEHPPSPVQRENVQEILHAGAHLLDLINEVLDLARIESGKFTVSREAVALKPLIADCLSLIRPQADARGIRLVEPVKDCGAHVTADRTRLKQVLLNLLSNAVKYNRPQGTIGIACLSEGDTLQIRISDTGEGLTADQQARLFVAFERLEADQSAVDGTGIGLALSKRLMEHMTGEIGVDSARGSGSTFWLRLPLADGQPDEAHPAPPVVAEPTGRRAGHQQWDVLCIEDNPANLRLIERILGRRDDIRLITASTPGLGLELARAHRPALILLDINLPDMDGYAVMQCLRENEATCEIPVLAISANAMPADLARGQAAGFADYLAKPLDAARLMAAIDRLIESMEDHT